ncbi:MAG: hypothetical protein LBT24_02770 [Tannerella sp.]|jgi:hypothetical protein|nr:hypothetical protein [Tannerella sp.]
MAQSETGHAINLANFIELARYIESLGGKYNPSPDRLKSLNLNSVLSSATMAFEGLKTANAPYLATIAKREILFGREKTLLSRIAKTAEIFLINPTAMKALKESVRKLRGTRATPKKIQEELSEGEKPVVYRSVSQLSFDQRINHFGDLISLLEGQPEYTPNEEELTVVSLNNLLNEMKTINMTVIDTNISVTNARNTRNNILYAPITGLVSIAQDVKKYLLGAFGQNSDEYKAVKKLQFRMKQV